MLKMIPSFFVLWALAHSPLHAEFMYLGRSDEGLMMGDAYTAVAEDEMLLFYNPAALARNSGLTLIPLKASFHFPDVIEKEINFDTFEISLDERFKNWPSEPEAISERILGYSVPFGVRTAPHLRVGGLGINVFALSKMRMNLANAVHPVLNLDYRYDRGFIVGYALNLTGQPRSNGHRSAIGVAFKTLNRQALKRRIDLFGNEMLRITSEADSYRSLREGLGYSQGNGSGFDLGWEHSFRSQKSTTTFAASWLDIDDIEFELEKGSETPMPQKQSVNFGLAHFRDAGLVDYTLAMDYHNTLEALEQDQFSFNYLHLGARLRFPLLGLYLGHNAGYGSVGLSFSFFHFDFKFGLYGLELGRKYRQYKEKNMLFSVELAKVSLDKIGF